MKKGGEVLEYYKTCCITVAPPRRQAKEGAKPRGQLHYTALALLNKFERIKMAKGKFIKPSWFEHSVNYSSNEQIILLVDIHGPAAYGVHWLLQEFLATQENYRASLKVVPGLIRKFNTTQAVMQAVLFDSGLYAVEGEEFFFSPELDHKLLKFEDFKLKQAHRAQIGAIKKEEKRQKEIAELQTKLSEDDSSQPHNITLHNNTIHNKHNIKKHSLFESEKKEEREDFKSFRKRILAEYAGKVVCNCVPGYRDGVELRVTAMELLEINGITLSADKAAEIWSWLATNKHMVGKIHDFAAQELAELQQYIGKKMRVNINGKTHELEIIDVETPEPRLYRLIFPDGGKSHVVNFEQAKTWATLLEQKQEVADDPDDDEQIHPKMLAQISASIQKIA